MQIEPSARPTGREVLRLLRGPNATTGRGVSITGPRTTQGSDSRIFVGRIRELGTLWKALHETEQGHAVTVIVEGESGVGKSALVHRFVEECRGADEKTVVLTGSCRERESVPYNAIDGVIDALSRFMIEISHADAMGLLPHRAHLLGQVFPVLRRVEAIAQVPRAHHDALDPIELRNRVFGALRELFDRLAARQRIIVVIDDIQWADADSKALLRELVRPPDEPPLLVVATLRTQSAPVSRDLRMTDANLDKTVEAMPGHVERVCVGSLPMEEAHSLALMLRERVSPELHVDAAAIAEEAGGHPLFIDELVRHAALGASPGGSLRLDDALWSRICRLDPTARTLLELVALMGRPVAREVLVRAADSPADLQQSLRGLRLGNLIRTSGGRREDLIETYHDRVREAVLARMDTGLKRSLEERLAITLEGIQPPDFEALALHWSGAGDRERAAVNAAHAAGQAASSLAFDHASRLYRKALDLWPREGEEGARLWGALAEALANTGRGTEAAEAYRTAAQWASDSMALGFRERAAEQLLRAGHIDAGLKEVRGILALVGLSLPRTPLGAFLSYLWQRLLLRIRGLGFRERSVGEVSPNALSVVDLCWSLAFTMWIVDTMRGYEAQTRHLRLALRAGEPYRVARALALEVPYAAMFTSTGWRAIDPLYDRATSLADRVGNAHGRAIVTTCAGVSAYLLGAFKTSLALCDEAEELLRKCTGTWGEIARARTFGMQALSMIGALKELSRRTPVFLREATERSDKYAATTIRTGHPNVCWLVHDDPVGAHREIDEAMAGWPQKQGFHLEHYYTLLARVQAYLYADKPDEAWKEMSTAWPQLERSFLLRVPSVRRQALFLYGRAALAKAQSDLAYRSELQHLARTLARRLRYREKLPWCVAMGDLLDAGVVHLEGNRQRTITLLATASASFAHSDMALHVAAVDLVRGSMLGGDEGTQLVDKASTWAAQETVRDMSKLTAMLIPGFSTLR
jgi:tetratricopeptide (TPR) repeat protein